MRALASLLLPLLLLLLAGPLRAQDKPSFEVPEKERDPGADRAQEGAEDDSLARTVERLAGWPQERARRAAERLIVQKEKSLPVVLDLLVSSRDEAAPLKPGAAYVLGRIGDPSHFMMLLHVAVEREQQRHAEVFLEAAWRLNEKETVAEAFRFFHLSETTLRREATRFVLDRVTRDNLPAIRDLLDRRKAERSFTREIGLRLLDRLVETRQVEWDEVSDRFYRALGDESPQVSARAMRLLASRNEPDNVRSLNGLITAEQSYWRQRSYAALSLAILAAAFQEQPYTPEAIEVLRGRKGMEHPKETLARAAGAIALAMVALRTQDAELVRLLDREIPIILIDAVGANRTHYRDFGTVMPFAYTMLRRITGQNFPDHAPAWASWWRDHGRTFRAKRELVRVEESDLPDVVVELTEPRSAGGSRVRLAVVGPRRPSFLHGEAFALPRDEMAALVALLKEKGLLERPEEYEGDIEAGTALVVMRVGDLDRTVRYRGTEEDRAARDAIVAEIRRLIGDYAWQLWWDMGEQSSWELFYATNLRWFRSHPDDGERHARLRSMVAAALDDLISVERRLEAARFVARLPGGGGALTEAEVAAFVRAAGAEREANAFVAEIVDLLVPEAGAEAAHMLLDAMAGMVGPAAQTLLVRLCGRIPGDELARLAGDDRWKVRRAAVLALAQRDLERARPVLAERLRDEEMLVRVAAAEALARAKDPTVLPALAELGTSDSPAVRESVAYAYGLLGGERGREGVAAFLFEDRNPIVRVRAIRGLVEGGDADAAELLMDLFRRETDVTVRAAAAEGLVDMETPEVVQRVIERLELTSATDPRRVALVNVLARFESDRTVEMLQRVLQGDDPLSADAAALGLARRWDEVAFIQLVRMLKRGDNALTAVRHLQLLTSQEFETESYQRQAENYEGWATAHATGNPRLWFTEALTQRGYDTAEFQAWAEAPGGAIPQVEDAMVPVLLKSLRDSAWFIRRNASFLLRVRIGEGAPAELSYQTTPEEDEAAIRGFHDWWAEVEKEREKREQG